jgi:hypothetical protein
MPSPSTCAKLQAFANSLPCVRMAASAGPWCRPWSTRAAASAVTTANMVREPSAAPGGVCSSISKVARRAVVLRGHPLAVPSMDRLRWPERREFGQPLSAERPSLLGEQLSLGIGEPKALGAAVCAQHTVLGAKVLDGLGLVATQPA